MSKKKYVCAGNGSVGDWDICIDEDCNDGSFQLIVDNDGMSISDDGTQVQIDLGGDAADTADTLKDLIEALEVAREDFLLPD